MKWWLIDSGAAVSVLSDQFKASLKVHRRRTGDGHYYSAANGSAVTMRVETQVTVAFKTGNGAKKPHV